MSAVAVAAYAHAPVLVPARYTPAQRDRLAAQLRRQVSWRYPLNRTWIQKVPGAAVHAAYVVWPEGYCASPDDADRTGFVGCVWQVIPDGPWFAVVGEDPMIGLGGPFPTLHDAHLAVDEATTP